MIRRLTILLQSVTIAFLCSLAVPKEAKAVCWSTITWQPTGDICWFACYCDDYDQAVGQIGVTGDNPQSPQTLPVNDMTPTCGTTDPVDLSNGQSYYGCQDVEVPGRNLSLVTTHTYNSGSAFSGPFGYGWTMNLYMRVHSIPSGDAVITSGNGRRLEYTYSGGNFTPPAGRFEELVKNPDGSWTLTQAHGEKYQFNPTGNLTAIEDRNGNAITLAYSADPEPIYGRSPFGQDPQTPVVIGMDYRLEEITDTTGRVISLNYNSDGLLDTMVDGTRTFRFDYDAATNDLLKITKPATAQFPTGVAKTFAYDDKHNLTQIKDAKDQVFVENHYDVQERVFEQILGGRTITLDYSVPGQTKETDRNGNENIYTFNANGLLTSRETKTRGLRPGEPLSFITTYAYSAYQNKTAETFPRGNGTKYVYDEANPNPRAKGNLLQVRRKQDMAQPDNDTNDIVSNFTYEPNFNRVKTATDPKGNVITNTYDYELPPEDPRFNDKGDLVTVTYPTVNAETPVVELAYNDYGQVAEVLDPNGNKTQYEYFPVTGYLKKIIQDPGTAPHINATTELTYDTFGYPSTVKDPNFKISSFIHNELGWLIEETNPLNLKTKYTYDANGNLTKRERQMDAGATQWQTTQYTYTLLNKLQTVTDPLNHVTTFGYDDNDNLHTVLDAENNTTTYDYDERDLLWKVADANTPQGITEYAYDDNGNLEQIFDANNNPTTYTYDLFDRLTATTYADASFEQFGYDKNSNMTSRHTPANEPVIYDYDALNRLTAKTYTLAPDLNVGYDYDAGSRLTAVSNQLSAISYTYDALNRIKTDTQTLAPGPYTLTYEYDQAGNRKRLTYPSATDMRYLYDNNNRLTTITQNGATLLTYSYDYLDRLSLKEFWPASRKRTQYGFDLADRLYYLKNYVQSSGGGGCFLAGTLVTMADGTLKPIEDIEKGEQVVSFDEAKGETAVSTVAEPLVHKDDTDEYYIINDRIRATAIHPIYVEGKWIKASDLRLGDVMTREDLSKEEIISLERRKSPDMLTVYNLEVEPFHNYFVVGSFAQNDVRTTQYGILVHNRKQIPAMEEAADRLSAVSSQLSAAESWRLKAESSLWSLVSGLWSVPELEAQALPKLNHTFNYTYDNVNNRLTLQTLGTQSIQETYGYNDIYELASVTGNQTHSYQYDNVGNRTIADGINYTPNNLNQYSQVGSNTLTYDNNENLTYDGTNTLSYDTENRLISATNAQHSATYGYDGLGRRISKTVDGVTTYFVYDGDQIIEERDSSGGLLASYTYGLGIDEPLTMNRNSTSYYYFFDGLGSVSDITDASGNVIESYNYDVFGQPTTLSTIGNPFYFTGREYDKETGLYHYRARSYSPTIGRFGQRDPVGNVDSENLYQYTLNNPVNYTDPSGEIIDTLADIGFIGYDLYRLFNDEGCKDNLKENLFALGGDVLGAIIPGLTGFGLAIREVKAGERFGGTIIRSMAERNRYLRSIADKSPSWMRQWLERGKVPPGYQVHHNIPLYRGGADATENMRLIDIDMHKVVTNLWRKVK